MRKLFLILVVIISLTSTAFSQAEITIDCPDSWGPGRYNKILVRISFDRSDGFARFTQDLPVGFEIIKDELPEGDFSWNGNQLNIVWMSIPESKNIKFSYLIKPGPEMQGVIDLGGKVVAVTGGNSKEIAVAIERQISIGGTSGLLPGEIKKEITLPVVTNVTTDTRKPQVQETSGTIYRVQVGTSSKEITENAMKKKLGIISKEKMTVVKSGKIFKYQLGEFRDKGSAVKLQEQLISTGIRDAFVVTVR